MSYLDKFDKTYEISLENLSTHLLESICKDDSDFLKIILEHIKDVHYGKVYDNNDILIEANQNLFNNVSKNIKYVLTGNIIYYNNVGKNINKFKETINKGLLIKASSVDSKINAIEVEIHKTSVFLLEQKGNMNLILSSKAMSYLVQSVDNILKILVAERVGAVEDYDFDDLKERLEYISNDFYSSLFGKYSSKEDFKKYISKISNKEMKKVKIDDSKVISKLNNFLDNAYYNYSKTIVSNNNKLEELIDHYEQTKESIDSIKEKDKLSCINRFDRECFDVIHSLIRDTKIAINYDIIILNNAMDDIRTIANAIIKNNREVDDNGNE